MEVNVLQNYIEESQKCLPKICQAITAYWQNSYASFELEEAYDLIQEIKNSAERWKLVEIIKISSTVGEEIKKIISSKNIITSQQNQFLFEQISKLEYVLILMHESIEDICIDDDALNESFFGDLELEKKKETDTTENIESKETEQLKNLNQSPEKIAEADEFEIDAEMIEIFSIEIDGHLKNISNNLQELEKSSDNLEAMLEIRRSAHTLKGSAGIIGLKNISLIAHLVEDLLNYISDSENEANKSVFELLSFITDCLKKLAKWENSVEINEEIAEIYSRFDEITKSLPKMPTAEGITSKPELIDFNRLKKEIAPIAKTSSKKKTIRKIENQEYILNIPKRSVVRVSLKKLDDLVNLTDEMSGSRSFFESRINEFKQQLQELGKTRKRLINSTESIEFDLKGGDFKNWNADAPNSDQNNSFNQTVHQLTETSEDIAIIHSKFNNLLDEFSWLFDTQKRLVEDIQKSLTRLQMVPVNSIASRLYRIVRLAANEEKKLASLEIENGEIEIDTQILDAFSEPLLHLLRNAVAHGIESPDLRKQLGKSEKGRIILRAYTEGNYIVFVISDDGQGISVSALKQKAVSAGFITQKEADEINDEEALSLIFLPGLTTASKISQISGRGVGMNIVKSGIIRRQGTISVLSTPQKGTSFTVRLPMSFTAMPALLVKAKEQTFAFPLDVIKQIIEVSNAEFERISAKMKVSFKGISYRFFDFNNLVNVSTGVEFTENQTFILLIKTAETPYALAVEQILRSEEIVVKPLGNLVKDASELLGATIMGDGSVVPILDLVYLIKEREKSDTRSTTFFKPENPAKLQKTVSVLIVDDSPSVRQLNSELIKNAGWQPLLAKDGLEALEILQNSNELPQAIMTDLEMPGMNGYELVESIKKQNYLRDIPIIIVSSRDGDEQRRKANDLGISIYLNKPFKESELIEKIKEITQ